MTDVHMTTNEENFRIRNEYLEELLRKFDVYLTETGAIKPFSAAHMELRSALGYQRPEASYGGMAKESDGQG